MTELTVIDAASLPAVTTEDAIRQAAQRARNARAPNTLRAYKADWQDFEAACETLGLPIDPTAETVSIYIDQLARRGAKVSTIRRRIASINTKRRAGKLEPLSVREEPLASVLRGIRREIGAPPKGARPLEIEELRQVVAACADGPQGRRNRALLLLGFAGGFRRSEVSGLDWTPDGNGTAYVDFVPEGLRVTLKRSKTNQTGELEQVAICRGAYAATCPVRALEDWRALLVSKEQPTPAGAVFRAVDRHGNVGTGRLHPFGVRCAIRDAVERAAKAGGASPVEIEALLDRLSGHSLRAGLVTTAFAAGLPSEDVQRQTRHRDLKTLLGYRRHASAFIGNVSGKIGL